MFVSLNPDPLLYNLQKGVWLANSWGFGLPPNLLGCGLKKTKNLCLRDQYIKPFMVRDSLPFSLILKRMKI